MATDITTRRLLLQGAAAAGLTGLCAPSLLVPPARAAERYQINIINTYSDETKALQALLDSKGWLEEYGVDGTTQNIADGSKLMAGLLGGSSDIALLSGFGQVLTAIEKGGALKMLGGGCLLTAQAMYAKNPAIKSMKDLEGKTVGTGSIGALLYELVVTLLKKKGVDVSKVTFVNIGSSADVFKAIVAGTVDAGPSLYDVYDEQARYGVHSLTDGDFWTELPEFVYQGAYASDNAIQHKRDGLVRTLAAYCKLYRYISGPDSGDDYVKAWQKGVGGDPKASAANGLSEWNFIQKYKPYATNLVLSEKQLDYMQQLNINFDAQKKVLPFDQVADMSLAQDAIKLLG